MWRSLFQLKEKCLFELGTKTKAQLSNSRRFDPFYKRCVFFSCALDLIIDSTFFSLSLHIILLIYP